MNKQNKALQGKIKSQMVDISKLHTPSGYARLIGHSRANVYLLIKAGSISSDNVFILDNKQQVILEDGKEDDRRKKV